MARFSMDQADNYGGGSGNYFNLQDDKQSAKIRFLYNTIEDVEGVAVHEIQVGNNKVEVECLREYNEPVDNCPLCAAGYKVSAKMYIPVYDETSKTAKIWTRGKKFFAKLSSLCMRYNPLVSTLFEVERQGKKGDTATDYQFYIVNTDNTQLKDLPSINPEGIAFYSKSYDELATFVNTGMLDLSGNSGHVDEFGRPVTRQPVNTRTPAREVPVNTPVRRKPAYSEEDNF